MDHKPDIRFVDPHSERHRRDDNVDLLARDHGISDTLAELMDTKEYLQSIVENSADLIITVGPDGLIKSFNLGAEKALGYRREEVIGKSITTVIIGGIFN